MAEVVDESSRLLPDGEQRDGVETPRRLSQARRASEAFSTLGLTGLTPVLSIDQDSEHEIAAEEDGSASAFAIWTVIPLVILGVFVANADGSLVVAASQRVASEFNSLSSASWLVTSYMLAQCASQPLYGKLSTIFGRKSNLAVCYIFFAAGCLVCAIGQQFWHVIAGRVVSGVGGAGMTALVSVIIADMAPVRSIAAWNSYVNIAATMGRSLGGPVGGLLTDTVGWRWSFLGQVPLTLVALVLILWKLPGRRNLTKDGEEEQTLTQKIKRVDFAGAIMLSLGITSFLLTLDFAAKALRWYIPVLAAAATVIFLTGFYLIERYRAKEPVLPLELITQRFAWNAYTLVGVQIAAQFAAFYSTPLYFQVSVNASVAASGLRLVPAVVGNALGGITSGLILSRTGRYKGLTIAASILATAGYTLMLIRWTGSTTWLEGSYLFLGGFGAGTLQSTTFVHLAANLDRNDMAIAGTTLYLSQNVFSLVGIQISTAVFHASLIKMLEQKLQSVPNKRQIISWALSSVASIRSLPLSVRYTVVRAYIDSLRTTFAASVVFASIGIALGIYLRESKMD